MPLTRPAGAAGSAPGRLLAALALLSLAAAACGPAATTSPSASVASAPPSIAPSPSPSAADVSAAFIKAITNPTFKGSSDVTGTITFGTFDGDADGTFDFNGGDSHTRITLSIAGQDQTTETISLGDNKYERTDDGPWVEGEAQAADRESLSDILRAVIELEDMGVETRDGRELHRLQLPDGGEIPAEAMGIDASVLKDPKFTMEFFAEPDGTPAVMAVEGTWTQEVNGEDLDAEMALAFTFKDLGDDPGIEAPEDVWEVYTSETFNYSMAHPADWTVKSSATGDEYQVGGQSFIYVAPQDIPAGMNLAGLRDALIESYQTEFGGDPETATNAALDGNPAVRLLYHATVSGNDVAFVDYAAIHGGLGWEVFIFTAAGGTEAEDIALFEDFVSTFNFTD